MKLKSRCLLGAVSGFLLVAIPHGILLLLIQFRVEFGKHVLSTMLLFLAAALEFPALMMGRLLKLPLENGATGFILPDFNLWGYALTILFWVVTGAVSGWILNRRNVPPKKILSGLLWGTLIVAILLLWAVKIFVFDS